MKVNLEDVNKTQKRIDVYIPADVVDEKRATIFMQVKQNANVKGFRPGKAPNNVIESMYGKTIKDELVSNLISESFEDALTEVKAAPINRPDITPGELEPKKDFHYSAVFDVLPEFDVSEYKKLELKKTKVKVKKEDVDKALENLQERSAESKLVEDDRGVSKGEIAIVDFEGKLNGETIKDLKQENVQFLVGEGKLIQEFEDNIIGMKKGEQKEFDITYDEDFQIKEAAGQTVNFTLKVNDIYERILPKINNEFAKELNYESLSDLKKKIKEDLTKQLENIEETKLKQQIVEILDKENDIEVPSSLVYDEEIRLKRDFAANFQRQGIPIPQMEGDSDAKFKERAVRNIKSSIILGEIAKKEDISATKSEIDEKLQEMATYFQASVDQVRELYQNENMLANLEAGLIEDKVIKYIIEKANVVEELEDKINIDNEG